jgi:hypothetical protein
MIGTMIPMVTGPRASPKSMDAWYVPTVLPSEEPAYSRAYAMVTGMRNARDAPMSTPTRMNIGRVLEKESMTKPTVDTKTNVGMIFSLLYMSKALAPRTRTRIIITEAAAKKYPGFATPHLTQYRGKKAATPAQEEKNKKLTTAGARILGSKRRAFFT